MRRRLYRPLADASDLPWLERKVSRSRFALRLLLRAWLTFAALMAIVTLVSGGGERFVPLVMAAFFGIPLAIQAVRALWIRPRALLAQRLLLRHRGLLEPGERPAALLGESLDDAVGRLRRRLAAQPAARPEVERALDEAERAPRPLLAALDRCETALPGIRRRPAAAAPDAEPERLRAVLESFAVVLASLEIEALLFPDFLRGDAALDALRSAMALLGTAPEDAERPSGGVPAAPPGSAERML